MVLADSDGNFDVSQTISDLQDEMVAASNNLEFEKAALLRDQINELKRSLGEPAAPGRPAEPVKYTIKRARNRKARRF